MRCKQLVVSISLALVSIFPLAAYGQAAGVCPAKSPTQRPAGITPSTWVLTKVLNYMVNPVPLVPGTGLVEVISHRGNWEYCPENTLESFHAAWDIGAEGVEMDVRLSAPGVDTKGGAFFPAGEVFLSHDWDLRGEAPSTSFDPATENSIYNIPPDALRERRMVDRHGKYLLDSKGEALHMNSLIDLLDSMLARAKALGLVTISTRRSDWTYVAKGTLLIIDVKGLGGPDQQRTQYSTFLEAVREMYQFEEINHVDMGDAIAFKVQFKDFKPYSAAQLLQKVTSTDIGYPYSAEPPRLIFIVFPEDICTQSSDPQTIPCTIIPPANAAELNDYLRNYPDFLVNDWQHRDEGDALTGYLTDPLWKDRGSAAFLASNNFAEGVRNSGGNCENTIADGDIVGPKPDPRYPGINTSFCLSDPIQRWESASLDYLIPGFGPKHATSITTDLYQNAMDYLTAVRLNNTNLLR